MNLSIETEGLLNPRQFDAWRQKRWESMHRGAALGLQEAASRIVPKIRADAARGLNMKRKGLERTFSARVHARRKDILPVVDFYSRIPWMGIHERGGVIQGPLLIPLTEEGRRVGRRAFGKVIQGLLAQGNAWIKQIDGGKAIVFAENIAESGRYLSRFRKAFRARQGLKKGARLQRGVDIPIAVLVPRVELKKRIRQAAIVKENLPMLAAAIAKRMVKEHG